MSYPWWGYEVTAVDGTVEDFQATGADPTDAMIVLLRGFNSPDEGQSETYEWANNHGGIKAVEYEHCLTFGVDAESDAILSQEGGIRLDLDF